MFAQYIQSMTEKNILSSEAFANVSIEFPIQFDLKIIYLTAEAQDLESGLERLLAELSIPCSLIQGISVPGKKYGKLGARVTVSSRETMDSLYAGVAKLPGVKFAL